MRSQRYFHVLSSALSLTLLTFNFHFTCDDHEMSFSSVHARNARHKQKKSEIKPNIHSRWNEQSSEWMDELTWYKLHSADVFVDLNLQSTAAFFSSVHTEKEQTKVESDGKALKCRRGGEKEQTMGITGDPWNCINYQDSLCCLLPLFSFERKVRREAKHAPLSVNYCFPQLTWRVSFIQTIVNALEGRLWGFFIWWYWPDYDDLTMRDDVSSDCWFHACIYCS